MKRSINLFAGCVPGLGTYISAPAQQVNTGDSIELKKRIYKASVITSDSKKAIGYLANLSDSNLYLSKSPLLFTEVKVNDLTAYPCALILIYKPIYHAFR